MNRRILFFSILLLFSASTAWGAPPPGSPAPANERESITCLMADRSGCVILVKRGVNALGYSLSVESGTQGAAAVEVALRGRSIVIRRSDFRHTERSGGRGAVVVSRSSRFARRLMLPPDADLRRVRRSVRDGVVTIFIPRLHSSRPDPRSFYYPVP